MFSASKTAGPSGYNISRSVRLRSSAGGNFTRTPSVAGNKKLFTISVWLKRGALGTASDIMSATSGAGGTVAWFRFNSSDQLDYVEYNGGSFAANAQSAAVFRDPSAWYHIVLAFDSAQATAANRLKIYVNNVQQTMSGTLPTLNLDSYFDGTGAHYIGREARSAIEFFDGYMTEFNFVDGQALTPSSFGSTNATTGVWQPAKYTGTYGNNGFYLNFSDNSAATAAAIGKDYSGNGNNWTPNNISVTSGVTYDSMIDSPTVSAASSNHAVYNPLKLGSGGTWTVSNANLSASNSGSGSYSIIASSIGMSSGKWYFEFTATSVGGGGNLDIGVLQDWNTAGATVPATTSIGQFATGYCYSSNGVVSNNNTNGSTYSSFTANDVVQVALDLDNNKIYFGKNGTWQNSGNPAAGTGSIYTVSAGTYFAAMGRTSVSSQTAAATVNFGQRPFSYTPPSGFKALNTYNLPASTVLNGGKYMAATLYTGTLLSNSITNAGSFKPDLVWVKSRSAATDHKLTDSVRGVTKALVSDSTAAETTDAQGVTAFGSAGFTVGTDTNYNNLSATYVGWQWQAGQGSTSSNTNGSITSTVSVNATAGFSIVTYTGTGANATVGHGLGVAPAMIIIKDRTAARTADQWPVYHKSTGASGGLVYLNSTGAGIAASTVWNNTNPTSSVFSVGTWGGINYSTDAFVAYCWSEIAGFSKFGSYTGNGSADGAFVYTGHRPRWLMVKRTDTTGDWWVWDSARNTFNVMTYYLAPNRSDAEFTANTIDFLSNGFKFRDSSSGWNASGGTYIFASFAEVPFSAALAR